jgi:hypothetical protein
MAAAVRASQIPWPYSYTLPAIPATGDSDLHAFGTRFQQLMETDLDQPSAQHLIELAGRLRPEAAGFAVNPVYRPVEIQVKSQASKRRRWVRGYHRRPGPTARIYSRLGLIVQLSHSPQSLAAAAAFLAGRKREAVRYEWRSHLSDLAGQGIASRDQTRAALGFLWAALRYRLRDTAGLVGRGADAVLRSRSMSDLAVWIPVLLAMLAIVRHDGLYGLITYDLNLIELGACIYGAIRFGRRRRGVKPARRKPGQVSTKLPTGRGIP